MRGKLGRRIKKPLARDRSKPALLSSITDSEKVQLMTNDYSYSPLVNFVVTATDTVCGEACVVTDVDDDVLTQEPVTVPWVRRSAEDRGGKRLIHRKPPPASGG